MKVLIADSCPEVSDCLVVMMQEIPHVELLAPTRDAQTTLASIRKNGPEVMIVDATIPGKRTDFLRTVRRENPDATLIILTSLAYSDYFRRSNGDPDGIFVDKPKEYVLLSEFATLSGQNCSVWVKFACGEFRALDSPIDFGLERLESVLED